MAEPVVRARDVVSKLTLTVRLTGLRSAAWRLWIGTKLIRLAALVIGCGVKIER